MSPLGPITAAEAERRGWQRRNAATLTAMLNSAHWADLPPIPWQVTTTGLVGRCDDHTPTGRRAAFEAWTAFLDATRSPETCHGATTHLRATRDGYGPQGNVRVVVLADVADEA